MRDEISQDWSDDVRAVRKKKSSDGEGGNREARTFSGRELG